MTVGRFHAGGSTTIGNANSQSNSDYLLLAPELGLFAVFDAGGSWAEMGARAGPVCAEVIQRVIREGAGEELRSLIERAFRAACEALLAEPDDNGWCGGSSVALALLRSDRVFISWLGDAMAHRVTGDRIEPLTRPHTFANELIRQGRTAEAAAHPNFRNVLIYSLGGELPDPLEVVSFALLLGDRLVLTTDGVTNHIPDGTILTACRTIADPTTCAEAIIEHAIMTGSRDNCTCAVIAFERSDDEPAPEPARKWWHLWK